jgi:hypothetical protein
MALPSAQVLLFDLRTDASESHDVAAAHSDVVAQAVGFMEAAHAEDRYWPSANASTMCCASCFKHEGCPAPCVGPPAPPPPPPPPPIDPQWLGGTWDASCGKEGVRHFSLALDAGGRGATIANVDSSTSCWRSGHGDVSADGLTLSGFVVNSTSCVRHASGVVHAAPHLRRVDADYEYPDGATQLTISWKTTEGSGWPTWSRVVPATAGA